MELAALPVEHRVAVPSCASEVGNQPAGQPGPQLIAKTLLGDRKMSDSVEELPSAVCDGGPHIVVPADLVAEWHGAGGGGADYSRACEVPEPAGIIAVGLGSALVVAGSPAFTYWIADRQPSSSALVVPRSWAIDFAAAHLRAVCDRTPASSFHDLGLVFHNESSECILFAASDAGPEWVYGYSRLSLARGRYRVLFAESRLGQELEVSIIRLANAERSG